MKEKISACLVCWLLMSIPLWAQPTDDYYSDNVLQYQDAVYQPDIRSVQLYVAGVPLSYPFLPLQSAARLLLQFDELTDDSEYYSYRLIHCNADWEPSFLDEFDYLDGFTRNDITDYHFSAGTLQTYVHYELEIPNEQVRFTKSGNYLLVVYRSGDENDLVLTRRLVVYENIVGVEPNWTTAALGYSTSDTYHRIQFNLHYGNFPITNPFEELSVTLLQNGRWDNARRRLQPTFLTGGSLRYDQTDQMSFPAGSDFRVADTRAVRLRNQQLKDIRTEDGRYHFYLFEDQPHSRTQPFVRFLQSDFNGKFLTGSTDGLFRFADPDYGYCHFQLNLEEPIANGNIYVFGGLSDWNVLPSHQLHYNAQKRAYEASIFLKQGVYAYQYAVVTDADAPQPDATLLEGNFAFTENDYQILVYYRSFIERYDRVIAYSLLNTDR